MTKERAPGRRPRYRGGGAPSSETAGRLGSSAPSTRSRSRANPRQALRPVPELPKSLVGLFPAVIIGTLLWFAAFVVLLVSYLGSDGPPSVWLWTALAGILLGFVGMGIMTWQRAAARRGSRGAQRGL